jgi:Tfp pilus assembly protein PilE
MSLTDELSQLQKLKDSGALSEAEFQAAKSKLLSVAASSPTTAAKPSVAKDAAISVFRIVGVAIVAIAILLGGFLSYGSYLQAQKRHAQEAADALLGQQTRQAEAKKAAENARRALDLTKALNRCTHEWNRQIGDLNAKAGAKAAQYESRGFIGKVWHANEAKNDADLMQREGDQYKAQLTDCETRAHKDYDPLP